MTTTVQDPVQLKKGTQKKWVHRVDLAGWLDSGWEYATPQTPPEPQQSEPQPELLDLSSATAQQINALPVEGIGAKTAQKIFDLINNGNATKLDDLRVIDRVDWDVLLPRLEQVAFLQVEDGPVS